MKKFYLCLLICSLLVSCQDQKQRDVSNHQPNGEITAIKLNPNNGKYKIAGIDNEVALEQFVTDIKNMLGADERLKIAENVQYPFYQYGNGKVVATLENKDIFLEKFDELFSEKVKTALLTQTSEDLLSTKQGVKIGEGEIWINKNEDETAYFITAINPK